MNPSKSLVSLLAVAALSLGASSPPHVAPWGINLDYIDRDQKPGQDFFTYANGGWLKTATIPPDRPAAGVGLELTVQNDARLKEIVADLHTRADLTPEETKLRDFYDAFTDSNQIEAQGLKPAAKDLAAIAAARTPEDLARLSGTPGMPVGGPFAMSITADDKNPDAYVAHFNESGLGMPDRDYYLRSDPSLAKTRDAYKQYLAQMLTLAGVTNADARAASVYAMEEKIAKAHWPAADRRDADKTYNPMTVPDLKKLAPEYPWEAQLTAGGIPLQTPHGDRVVIIGEASAFPAIAKVFADTPIPVWRDFFTVRYLHALAPFLGKKVDDTDFAFYGTVIQGRTRQLDRETRGVRLLDNRMGEALGRIYVQKYFPPESREKIRQLVQNLLAAYEEDIKTLDWMTPETRTKALDKLHHFTVKVGYPDHWRDYSALEIRRDALLQDVKNAQAFQWNREVKRIDQPVDKTEWGMTPPTVNAYYNPSANEIVFPAGILQAPDFDPSADDAVNYGAIGAVIGHEISHGFDDQGSKYDGQGVLRSWWTDADRKNFQARIDALAQQYDQYEPLPGIHVNGKLTLGENIADLAGLVIANKAYHLSLHGKPAPVLDGYSGDQRFYLAFAQSWRSKVKDETTRQRLLSNEHSPAQYRVNGVVRNDDGWYAAFPEVKPSDPYYTPPDRRVHLW